MDPSQDRDVLVLFDHQNPAKEPGNGSAKIGNVQQTSLLLTWTHQKLSWNEFCTTTWDYQISRNERFTAEVNNRKSRDTKDAKRYFFGTHNVIFFKTWTSLFDLIYEISSLQHEFGFKSCRIYLVSYPMWNFCQRHNMKARISWFVRQGFLSSFSSKKALKPLKNILKFSFDFFTLF